MQNLANDTSDLLRGNLRSCFLIAQRHCANFCRGGLCSGLDFRSDGSALFFRKAGCPCLLQLGQRCPYFETAVLPMERRAAWPTPREGEVFREAARTYRLAFPETVVIEPATRKCPDCGKRFVEYRKRYCLECRKRRRKATNAAVNRNWRKTAVQRDAVNGNGSSPRGASRVALLTAAIPILEPPNFEP
jgi:hypothetical protein